jgi:hypothetical protein
VSARRIRQGAPSPPGLDGQPLSQLAVQVKPQVVKLLGRAAVPCAMSSGESASATGSRRGCDRRVLQGPHAPQPRARKPPALPEAAAATPVRSMTSGFTPESEQRTSCTRCTLRQPRPRTTRRATRRVRATQGEVVGNSSAHDPTAAHNNLLLLRGHGERTRRPHAAPQRRPGGPAAAAPARGACEGGGPRRGCVRHASARRACASRGPRKAARGSWVGRGFGRNNQ